MAKNPFLRYYTETIPSGANNKLRKDFGGRWFVCKESSAVFGVIFDDGAENPCEVGIGFKHTDEDGVAAKFKSIILVNNTGNPITCGFYVGSTEVIDARLNTLVDRTINVAVSSDVASYPKATSGTLLNGGTVFFTGLDGVKKRLSFSVKNCNPAGSPATDILLIYGQNGIAGHECDVREAYGARSGGQYQLYNNSGNPILYRVMEVFPT